MTRVVVMGVSGSGKSTVGSLLARRLGVPFVDADDLHPDANKEKMRAGVALTDDDRAPWLQRVGAALNASDGMVVACSALRHRYRDVLREAAPGLVFLHLDGSPGLLAERVAGRKHEFMSPALLASQLAALDPPAVDEPVVRVTIDHTPDEIVDLFVAANAGGLSRSAQRP
jgi:gluconokinase